MASSAATAARTTVRKAAHPASMAQDTANARNPRQGTRRTRSTGNKTGDPAKDRANNAASVKTAPAKASKATTDPEGTAAKQAEATQPKAPTKAEVRAAKQAEIAKAIPMVQAESAKQEGSLPLFFVLVTNGDFRVHRPDCKSVITDLVKSDYSGPAPLVVKTAREAVMEMWDDQIREQFDTDDLDSLTDEQLGSYFAAVDFHGCVKFPGYDTGSVKRDAKHRLAQAMIGAMGDAFTKMLAEDIEALGGREVAGAIASAWVHHLPTGEKDGQRYWPTEELPRPDRSDWR